MTTAFKSASFWPDDSGGDEDCDDEELNEIESSLLGTDAKEIGSTASSESREIRAGRPGRFIIELGLNSRFIHVEI